METKKYGVTTYDPAKTYNGFTLFAPMGTKNAWLIDMKGRLIKRWQYPNKPGNNLRLLNNGNLLYATRMDVDKRKKTGAPMISGFGGIIKEVDWDDNLVWEYEDPFLHHDFYRLDNGNTLVLKYVRIPPKVLKYVRGGVPGTEDQGKIWTDEFNEVTPEGKIVWKWKAYEHLDPEKHQICPLFDRREWTHANSCEVLPNGNILTSLRNINLIVVIDRKSGEIIWEWGNQVGELGLAHDPSSLPNGNFLMFDNGEYRRAAELHCSIVVEVNPKTKKVEWEYSSDPPTSFYSAICGSAQRLPNSNTLICSTVQGRIFEVTKEGKIVWEYVNPFHGQLKFGIVNFMFKAYRYSPDYPAFQGKEFDLNKLEALNLIYGFDAF